MNLMGLPIKNLARPTSRKEDFNQNFRTVCRLSPLSNLMDFKILQKLTIALVIFKTEVCEALGYPVDRFNISL